MVARPFEGVGLDAECAVAVEEEAVGLDLVEGLVYGFLESFFDADVCEAADNFGDRVAEPCAAFAAEHFDGRWLGRRIAKKFMCGVDGDVGVPELGDVRAERLVAQEEDGLDVIASLVEGDCERQHFGHGGLVGWCEEDFDHGRILAGGLYAKCGLGA